ncbi:uncharacterized protein G2W53_000355 [Senna tora]|uniref:Uncharacterized protein n=1 Tax=Senna tora TaxID=362788 RepID=A0A835CKI3_9FABA|nr:uncharacterized protein G2W53_000355 [Senna tora]
MANVDKGWMVADHVNPSGSQGAHSSKKGQASKNNKAVIDQVVISSTLLDIILKNQQTLNDADLLKQGLENSRDHLMEQEHLKKSSYGMFFDVPSHCRQRNLSP